MPEVVDARGMDCPHPVILTKRALEETDRIITIVDNETACENVSRLAENQGCWLVVQRHDDGIYLQLTKMTNFLDFSRRVFMKKLNHQRIAYRTP